jgi:hypothetical protein
MAILVPKGQRREPRNYKEVRNTRQCLDEILDQSLGNKVVSRIACEVAKGQHGNRGSVPGLAPRGGRVSGGIALFLDLPANR